MVGSAIMRNMKNHSDINLLTPNRNDLDLCDILLFREIRIKHED